jgi:hypothetical protein
MKKMSRIFANTCAFLFMSGLGLAGISLNMVAIKDFLKKEKHVNPCVYRLYKTDQESGALIFLGVGPDTTKRLGVIEFENDSIITITNDKGESIDVQVDEKYLKPTTKVNKL